MNINEQMNQLGQIASVGYTPTDTVVDQLVTRTKRTRAFRQGSAALVGSVGAIGLGLLGAQVFVNLTSDQDAASIPIRDLAFNNMTFEELEGKDYTGLGKSPEELANAWKKVQEGATIVPAAPAPVENGAATCDPQTKVRDGWVYVLNNDTGCSWAKKERAASPDVAAGWIVFNNIQGECKTYTDTNTGTTVFAAFIDAGESWKKLVKCDGNAADGYSSGSYRYIYKSGEWKVSLSGTTCTGLAGTDQGAPAVYSCNPNKSTWTHTDPANYKKFAPACWYHHIGTTFVYEGKTYQWTGAWTVVPEPTPTVTPTVTPTPEPEPEPEG